MKPISFLVLLSAVVSQVAAQSNTFSYKREISAVTSSGYHAVVLTPDIFAHCKDDLSDIRIYSIAGADTTEIPYLLQIKRRRISSRDFTLPEFNRSSKGNTVFVSFELPPNTGLTSIELSFQETNFFASVAIEGSDDRKQWFDISRDQKIFSVNNSFENYRYTKVNFPETKYKFIRLSIESQKLLQYGSTTFKAEEISPGEFTPVSLTWKTLGVKKEKQTRIDVKLQHYQPLAVLQLTPENNKDFYRRCRIEILTDSTKSEKGWIKNYRLVADGYITSFLNNVFELSNQSAKEVRITVENRDDQPLVISSIKASSPAIKLISNLGPGANFLFYGNKQSPFPSYDFQYFEKNIPPVVPELTLGPEVDISVKQQAVSALFENKVWLWAIIVVAISVLGFFTVRMMKVKQTA